MTSSRSAALCRVVEALAPLGRRVRTDAPLGALTTYRVGGTAAVFVTAGTSSDLRAVAAAVAPEDVPVLVVGRGSNLLVADAGFPGVAVTLDPEGFGAVTVEGDQLRAGAAVALPALARQSVEAGLTGLEWAVGVPGSVGGGIRMNAGGHGSDMAHTMVSCDLVDLGDPTAPLVNRPLAEMDYGYRHSSVGSTEVVVSAVFGLRPGAPEQGRRTIREIVAWRREHQPGGQNAGSVFTNPPGDSAGRLVDATGLKARRWRTAMVSPKHANFIQADPGGRSEDVYHLMGMVKAEVEAATGVRLEAEVRLVGFPVEPPEPQPPQPKVEI
jgi:UDP-N-acetylmuramate dehydrogenase